MPGKCLPGKSFLIIPIPFIASLDSHLKIYLNWSQLAQTTGAVLEKIFE